MKTNILKIGILLFFAIFLSSNKVEAKDVKIDQHVTSLDGCKWHIVGTIGIDVVGMASSSSHKLQHHYEWSLWNT